MSEGLNKVMLLGNVGADPELKMTSGGQAVLKIRLATSDTYLDKNKVRQERTEWHRVTIWGKRAEALAKFVNKGDRLFVEGRLVTESWEKDGVKQYKTGVTAENIILAGGGKSNGGGARKQSPDVSHGGGGEYEPAGGGGGDDDIPFVANVSCEAGERWWARD